MFTTASFGLRDYPEEQQKVILEAAKAHYKVFVAGGKASLPSSDSIVFKVFQEMVAKHEATRDKRVRE